MRAGGAGWRQAEQPGCADLLSKVCWRPQHTPVPTAHPCPHGTQRTAQQEPQHGLCVQGEQHASLGVGLVPGTEHMHWDISSAPITWLSLTVLALWQGSQI